jgi:hypothetical protein
MSSVTDPHPDQPAADELVAYLDGELGPEECRRVEERLAADAQYRQQLRDLDLAWEALEVLPTRKADDDFARTTMELVTVAAQGDASSVTAAAAEIQRRRKLWFATAAIAGVLLGFGLARWTLPNQNRELLDDLPVIRHVDTLRQIDSADFLRRLSTVVPAEQLMNDEAAIASELQAMAATSGPLEARRQWVDNLSEEEKVVLAAQATRFKNFEQTQQERVRNLERDVRTGGENLQRTLLAYEQWLSRLTAGRQEELRQNLLDLPVQDQVAVVGNLVERQREQSWRPLSTEDAEKLRSVLLAIAAERQAELVTERRRRDGNDRPRRGEGGALTLLSRELLRNDDDNNKLRRRVVNELSPEAREHLDSLSGWRRNAQLWRWIVDSLQKKVDSDQLERFFAEKLNNTQREQLLSLPPKEMQAQLERLYYATELGYGDAAQWWSEMRESMGSNRPGPDHRGFRPDAPPRERGSRDGGEPFFDSERRRGPGGPPPSGPSPRDGEFRDRRRPPPNFPPEGPRPRRQQPGPPPEEMPPREEI